MPGPDQSPFFEAHRQEMIRHFAWLYQVSPAYSRYAVKAYIAAPGCPFPQIGAEVRAHLIELGVQVREVKNA